MGRTLSLSLPRRLVCDLVHFAHQIPTVPVQRVINVAALERQRAQLVSRPGWCTIFTKALALASAEFPEMRRAYLSFPWARLYEHSESIASVAIEREYRGENGVFFGHFIAPEKQTLAALEAELRRLKVAPIETVADFQICLFICRLPLLLRRFAWWYITHFRGYRKATWLGTFGVSVYSSLGAESLHPLSPITTTMNYGVIQDNGDVQVRLVYDHRVMDGATIARVLARMDQILNTDILAEMRSQAAPTTSVTIGA
jgi:pyruvate/2-oxoglutarate dehydrogenase complex dihydrolipoamide acyltransferase (E2) component